MPSRRVCYLNAVPIRPIEPRDVPEVALLLARALHDDPAYAYLLPGTGIARRAALQQLFAGNLRAHLPFACTRVLCDREGRIVSTVTLRPPGDIAITLAAMLRYGLVPFALRNGTDAVRRLLRIKSIYDGLESLLGQGRSFWHVHMMGVLPEAQGQGHGSEILSELLASTVDVELSPGALHPTVLTTHKERNLPFYERAGFDIVHEQTLNMPKGPSYRVWGMRRPRFSEQLSPSIV